MDIRLIASDIDGTILPHRGKISDATRRAVKALGERGIDFVISSGRWYIPARNVAMEAGIEKGYMIISSGGAVVDMAGNTLKEWTMSEADVQKAYDILKNHDVLIKSFVRSGLYQVNTRVMPSHVKEPREYYGEFCRISDDQQAFETIGLGGVYKFEGYTDDVEELARAEKACIEAGLHVTSSYKNNIEVSSPGMGKATALRWLAEYKNISMDQVMAFGDNTNDKSMLCASGWPVAVGNAVDELKAVARIVGDRCEDDGVARVIEKYVLGAQER